MKLYRVYAEYTTVCYVDVLAQDEVEAHEKADSLDGAEFTPIERDNWNVLFDGITELKEEA